MAGLSDGLRDDKLGLSRFDTIPVVTNRRMDGQAVTDDTKYSSDFDRLLQKIDVPRFRFGCSCSFQ